MFLVTTFFKLPYAISVNLTVSLSAVMCVGKNVHV